MRQAIRELRLYLAEILLEWSWKLMPEGPEKTTFACLLDGWLRFSLNEAERKAKRGHWKCRCGDTGYSESFVRHEPVDTPFTCGRCGGGPTRFVADDESPAS